MNDIELAKAAFQFLRRVQLSGDEALTFIAVMQWLDRLQQVAPEAPIHAGANGAEAHPEV